MEESYTLPIKPAGSDELALELYSEQDLPKGLRHHLKRIFEVQIQPVPSRILIVGGRCGMTAELLFPYASTIDIIEESPFVEFLEQRFKHRKDVKYFFGKEGLLGETLTLIKPAVGKVKVHIHDAKDLSGVGIEKYDIIIIQGILFDQKTNVLAEIIRKEHTKIIAILSRGKISNSSRLHLMNAFEDGILKPNYEHCHHERVQGIRQITGRRNESIFYDVDCWTKKPASIVPFQALAASKYEAVQAIEGNPYETKALVDMYIEFHYGKQEYFGVKNYPKMCADKCIDIAKEFHVNGRALDIGCAIGRSTVEMASYFQEVIGIDYSEAFIKGAEECLDKFHEGIKNVKFEVGDACKMDSKLGKFSLIFGGNLIDRLQDPEAFLTHVNTFLEPKGILILSSPYSWLQQYTPLTKWIGGYKKEGQEVTTQYGLKSILEPKGIMELRANEDMFFVIKENEWLYQYTRANFTFWMKKE